MEKAEYDIDVININRISKLLPHRYPFLLVDKVVNVKLGHSGVGIKNVTMNEQFFTGHFPAHPIMPGVLIIEAMAQTAGIVALETLGAAQNRDIEKGSELLVFFMSIDEAKFRKPVGPGDQLMMHVTVDRQRGPVWRFKCEARVDGVLATEAVVTAMIGDKTDK